MNIEDRMKNLAAPFRGDPGCWNWPLCIDRYGYGQIKVDGKTQKAHRWSYYVFCGGLRDNMVIMHLCDNRACFNPDHLHIGTQKDNVQDMITKGRAGWQKK